MYDGRHRPAQFTSMWAKRRTDLAVATVLIALILFGWIHDTKLAACSILPAALAADSARLISGLHQHLFVAVQLLFIHFAEISRR